WIELAHSGLTGLPASLASVQIFWRGVAIDARIAFHPETLSAHEILTEPNAERRRIMVERVGYERLFDECNPTVVDRDRDAGGERLLMRIDLPMDLDNHLLCVAVHCPSTGRKYVLRVPPGTATCRHASAWLAGYDNVDAYQPI